MSPTHAILKAAFLGARTLINPEPMHITSKVIREALNELVSALKFELITDTVYSILLKEHDMTDELIDRPKLLSTLKDSWGWTHNAVELYIANECTPMDTELVVPLVACKNRR